MPTKTKRTTRREQRQKRAAENCPLCFVVGRFMLAGRAIVRVDPSISYLGGGWWEGINPKTGQQRFWRGRVSYLLHILDEMAPAHCKESPDWPRSATALSRRLMRHQDGLKLLGVNAKLWRTER